MHLGRAVTSSRRLPNRSLLVSRSAGATRRVSLLLRCAAAPSSVPADFVALAHELADVAALVSRRYWRSRLTVETKGDSSPVTLVDREVEAALRGLILGRHPSHSVFGEEAGLSGGGGDWAWILDPIVRCPVASSVPTAPPAAVAVSRLPASCAGWHQVVHNWQAAVGHPCCPGACAQRHTSAGRD